MDSQDPTTFDPAKPMESQLRRTPKRFVFTGTGRSGTHYIAKVLQKLGIRTWHEGIFNAQSPHIWRYSDEPQEEKLAEVSYVAASRLVLLIFQNIQCFFVVRDPMDTLNSMVHLQRDSVASEAKNLFYPVGRHYFHTNVDLFCNFVGPPNGDDVIDAARWIVAFHGMAVQGLQTGMMSAFKLEDMGQQPMPELANILEVPHEELEAASKAVEPQEVRTKGKDPIVTWDTLNEFIPTEGQKLYTSLCKIGMNFGYHWGGSVETPPEKKIWTPGDGPPLPNPQQ